MLQSGSFLIFIYENYFYLVSAWPAKDYEKLKLIRFFKNERFSLYTFSTCAIKYQYDS